jgi:ATP-binding cassette, subfamily B (MDR/TAP), member 1
VASEAKTVNALTSNIVGLQITNIASFLTGMIIAFYFSWSITLVTLALSPFIMLAGQLQAKFMTGFSAATDDAYKDSGNLIQEAVTNIRTVASFGNEQILLGFLNERLKKPESLIVKKANIAGVSLGYSQLMMFVIYAIVFYVGAIFHRDQGLHMRNMFASIFAIMFAAFGAGNNNQFMVDVGQAYNAAKNIFEILDTEDEF